MGEDRQRPVYRWSSMAKQYYHVKLHPGCPTPINGSKFSGICCGMFDRSAKGKWQEADKPPPNGLRIVICPTCARLT